MILMDSTTSNGRLRAEDVKRAASGRWQEILPGLSGFVSPDHLDGRHHPCPKCGGRDRFRALDTFDDDGAVFCNQCFSEGNGDGLAAAMWLLHCDFITALGRVADLIELQPHAGPRPEPTKPATPQNEKPKSESAQKPKTVHPTLAAAIAALQWSYAKNRKIDSNRKPDLGWQYQNASGEMVGVVCRWNLPDGNKTFGQVSRVDSGWICGAMPEPRPLLGLPEVLQAETIFICEGEKVAEAIVKRLGLTATSPSQGAKSPHLSDWSVLDGKKVIILPDNDPAGEGFAAKVAGLVGYHSPSAEISIKKLPDLPEKGDAYDWLQANPESSIEDLRRVLDALPNRISEYNEIHITSDGKKPKRKTDAKSEAATELITFEEGERVRLGDRNNIGTVQYDGGGLITVEIVGRDGVCVRDFPRDQVRPLNGSASGKRTDEEPRTIDYEIVNSAEFATKDYSSNWLFDGIMREGQPQLYGGPSKTLETSILVDQCLSIAAGVPFLGQFAVPKQKRVLLLSSESGTATLQETARRICRTKGIELAGLGDQLHWGFRPPMLTEDEHILALAKLITERKIDILAIDPAYLSMNLQGNEAANQFAVGAVLANLTMLQADTGVTPILAAHFRMHMPPGTIPTLEHVAGAGFGQWARQWFLLNRREQFNPEMPGSHRLLMAYGGSAGHCGTWGLDIEEGLVKDGRYWQVKLSSLSEIRKDRESGQAARKRDQEQRKYESDRAKILTAAKRFPEGTNKTEIRAAAGLNPQRFDPVWLDIVQAMEVVPCECSTTDSRGRTRTNKGFKLKT